MNEKQAKRLRRLLNEKGAMKRYRNTKLSMKRAGFLLLLDDTTDRNGGVHWASRKYQNRKAHRVGKRIYLGEQGAR